MITENDQSVEENPQLPDQPDHPLVAQEWLERGNQAFAAALQDENPERDHAPFAAVLGCSDARVPVEQVFNQGANRIFVIRLAGNVLSKEALGSLDFAIGSLESLRLIAVLGHTGCGAVTGAVKTYLELERMFQMAADHPLRSTVDHLWIPVGWAADTLRRAYSPDREDLARVLPALIDLSAMAHAALTASAVQKIFNEPDRKFKVLYGLYNLQTRQIGLPSPPGTQSIWQPGLQSPPEGHTQLQTLLIQWANSSYIRQLLKV